MVISAVPNINYKVKTEWLKDGCICVNVAGEKNFEGDVRDKVRHKGGFDCDNGRDVDCNVCCGQASIYVPSVGQMTIAMLQRNLLRLRKYRNMISDAQESTF